MKAHRTTLQLADDEFDRRVQQVIDDVRGVVFNCWREQGITDSQLAAATRLAPNTISRFASGETKSPHFRTAARLAMALDLEIFLARRSTGEIVRASDFGKVTPVVPRRRRG